MKSLLAAAFTLGALCAAESLQTGSPPPKVVLESKTGGLVDGSEWSSESLRGKMTLLFYVDPDKKDMNEHVGEAIRDKGFPSKHFRSVAVINMSATLMPNFVLNRVLAGKQQKYSRTIYVRDIGRNLVSAWGLRDDSYDIVLFDENGIVKLVNHGEMDQDTVEQMIGMISEGVGRLAAAAR